MVVKETLVICDGCGDNGSGGDDRDGHPIHIGDILDFDADEWGEPMQFSVRLEEGQIVHPGATSDLSAWCRVVKCVAESAASTPTEIEIKHLRECHATKGTHTIDCALDQQRKGTWGKRRIDAAASTKAKGMK